MPKFLRRLTFLLCFVFLGVALLRPPTALAAETLIEGNNTNLQGDDNYKTNVQIGFTFNYYETPYTQLTVSNNGFVTFGGSGGGEYSNESIPYNNTPNAMIAAFWDDLIVQANRETIYYYTVGSAPNRKFIVQWTNMYFYSNPTLQMGTFQIMLYEGSNKIQMRYLDLYGSDQSFGSSATVGIENINGSNGIQFSHESPVLTSGQCITFTPSDGDYSMNNNATCDEYRLYDANAPAAPILTGPTDGVNEESLIPTFTWQAANKATSYTVLVATDPNFANIVYNQAGITATSFTPPNPLAVETLFYWRVQSVNSTTTALSDVRTFTTMHAPVLSSLGPAAQINGSYSTTDQPGLNFTIADSVGAHTVKYRIQVDNNSDFGSPEVDYTSALGSTGPKTFTVGQAVGTGSYAVGSEGQKLANGNYYWRVKGIDSINAEPPYTTANNGGIAFRIYTGNPEITSVQAAPAETTANITWVTTQPSSSRVEYGRVPTYGFQSSERDTSTRVTNHTLGLTNLVPCSRYFYRVKSKNIANREEISSQGTFSTTGCVTSLVEGSEEEVTPAAGGTISYSKDTATVTITAPENFVNQPKVTLQINRLETTLAPAAPSGKNLVQELLYNFSAVNTSSVAVTNFDEPVSVVIAYGTDIESQFEEESLDLYLYSEDDGSWEPKSCVVDTGANTLTCSLPSFSTYGVMGKGQSRTTRSSSSSQSQRKKSESPSCSALPPGGTPKLFRIDRNETTATLWIEPAGNPYTGFIVWYGENGSTENHTDTFALRNASGMVQHTIDELLPGQSYSFAVQAMNDCRYSEKSNVITVTGTTGTVYKDGRVEGGQSAASTTPKTLSRSEKDKREEPAPDQETPDDSNLSQPSIEPVSDTSAPEPKKKNLWQKITGFFGL